MGFNQDGAIIMFEDEQPSPASIDRPRPLGLLFISSPGLGTNHARWRRVSGSAGHWSLCSRAAEPRLFATPRPRRPTQAPRHVADRHGSSRFHCRRRRYACRRASVDWDGMRPPTLPQPKPRLAWTRRVPVIPRVAYAYNDQAPSIAPDIYLVLEDFGPRLGRACARPMSRPPTTTR
jgi:hypothetical protein